MEELQLVLIVTLFYIIIFNTVGDKLKNNILKDINMDNITAGLVAGAFGCTGSAILVIQTANNLGLSDIDTISWLFSIYVLGGLLGLILSLKYKMPISGAYTIAGTVLLLESEIALSLPELTGAFLITGIIIFIIGITKINEKIIKLIPFEIIMAMVSGVLVKFTLNLFGNIQDDLLLSFCIILSFILFTKYNKRIPAILSTLIFGSILIVLFKKIDMHNINFNYVFPRIIKPEFNKSSILSISVPLAILILGSENSQAIGVLNLNNYKPPINNMTIFSGLGTIIASFFGGHAVNIAGPMTAICSSDDAGKHSQRYMASVLNGIIFILFGLFASYTLSLVNIMPISFISSIALIALLRVIYNSLKNTFSLDKFKTSTVFTFLISMSSIEFLNIGTPVLALIFGTFIAYILEKDDLFKK